MTDKILVELPPQPSEHVLMVRQTYPLDLAANYQRGLIVNTKQQPTKTKTTN